jgi:hypothetical protein
VASEEPIFTMVAARIRDIRIGPGSFLYILAGSDNGKALRVVPNP